MGKIDAQLWKERRIIWCQSLVDNLSYMYSKRTTPAPEKPFSEEFSGRKCGVGEESDAGNTQSKVKESKGEERKGNPSGAAGAAPVKPPRRRKPTSLTKTQEERFNRFWDAYPRKQKIGEAEKAWAKIDPDDALTDKIIEAVRICMTSDYRFREERYTPLPASWLNGKEWQNQYGGEQNGRKKGGGTDGFRPSEGFKRED